LAPRAGTLWVTGQRSGRLYAVDTARLTVTTSIPVCSEPAGVLVSPDERSVWVACAQDATVVRVDVGRGAIVATAHTAPKPWSLALAPDGGTLYASHLLGPGVTAMDPEGLTVRSVDAVPDVPRSEDARVPNGVARALYDVTVRPSTGEIWVPHTLLASTTPQYVEGAPTPAWIPGDT